MGAERACKGKGTKSVSQTERKTDRAEGESEIKEYESGERKEEESWGGEMLK